MLQGIEPHLFWLTQLPNPPTFLDDRLHKLCPAYELIMSPCQFCCWALDHLLQCKCKQTQRSVFFSVPLLTLLQKLRWMIEMPRTGIWHGTKLGLPSVRGVSLVMDRKWLWFQLNVERVTIFSLTLVETYTKKDFSTARGAQTFQLCPLQCATILQFQSL